MLISSADGGFAVNDAVRMAYYIAGLGHVVDGTPRPTAPKGGAQFHFSLPGSTQGFRVSDTSNTSVGASINNVRVGGSNVLSLGYEALGNGKPVAATTPVFAPKDVVRMRTYELTATPLVYPGQVLTAVVSASKDSTGAVTVRPLVRRYGEADRIVDIHGPSVKLEPGQSTEQSWVLPDCASQPIAEIGLSVAAKDRRVNGSLLVDRLGWTGTPDLVLRPPAEAGDFWRRAWVDSADNFTGDASGFRVSRDRGEGMVIHGTRQWTDYKVSTGMTIHLGHYAGLAVRVRGLRRFYAARFCRNGTFEILRVLDDERVVLASTPMRWKLDETIPVSVTVQGSCITACAGDTLLTVDDDQTDRLASGGFGFLVADGTISADRIRLSSPDTDH